MNVLMLMLFSLVIFAGLVIAGSLIWGIFSLIDRVIKLIKRKRKE